MKRLLLTASLAALLSSPALALEFTNLDTVDHKVAYRAAGATQVIDVPVDETVRVVGQTNGFVSLLLADGTVAKPDKDVVHADGIFSGLIGASRTSDIPADAWDAFVIWPDGTFGVQQRRRGGHRFN